MHLAASTLDRERDILANFAELEQVERTLPEIRRGYTPPELLANPRGYPAEILGLQKGERVLPARFQAAVRYGHRFEFRGEQPACASALSPVPPGYRRYAYAAAPSAAAGAPIRNTATCPGSCLCVTMGSCRRPTIGRSRCAETRRCSVEEVP